jgi:hypothetical protein
MAFRPRNCNRFAWPLILVAAASSLPHELHAAFRPQVDGQCQAKGYLGYIGKPVGDLEQFRLPNARFVCNVCATTADVIASRLTVIYSEKTKRILKMYCQ